SICKENPLVFNHNVEVVPRIFPLIRPEGDFETSLCILRSIKQRFPHLITKTGFMVGIGETNEEVYELLRLIKDAQIDRVTIGQYLRPTRQQIGVARYVTEQEFEAFATVGHQLGLNVLAGSLVRSSYRAGEFNMRLPYVIE
ncbi:MAG: lipoyl synthase, partial [Candidatus Margulisiibacteriota bacterium]